MSIKTVKVKIQKNQKSSVSSQLASPLDSVVLDLQRLVVVDSDHTPSWVLAHVDHTVDTVAAALGGAAGVAAVVDSDAIRASPAALVVLVGLLEGSEVNLVSTIVCTIPPVDEPSV